MSKVVMCIPPGVVVDDGAYTSTCIDTAGFDHCTIYVSTGFTDVALAALKVAESDALSSATALSSGADVTGLVWGTSLLPNSSTTSSLPSGTDDNKVFAAFVECAPRKRYLQIQATAGNGTTGTYLSAIAILSKAGQGPYDATTRGLGSNLIA